MIGHNLRESSTNINLPIETSPSKLIRSEEIMRVNSTIPKDTHSYQKPIPDNVEQPKPSVSPDENPNSPRSSTTRYESENTKALTSTHTLSQINESLLPLEPLVGSKMSPTKWNALLEEGSPSFSFDELLTKDIGATVTSDKKKLQKPHPTYNPRSSRTTNEKSFGKSRNITHEEYTILLTKVVHIEQEMKAQSSLMRNIEHFLQTKFGNSYGKETLTDKFGTDFPVKTLDDLYSVEKKLSESLKARKDLKSTITMTVDPEEKLSKNMAVVMKKLIGREIAMKYTAIRKIDGKMVFSVNVPNFCNCIVEALTSRLQMTERKIYAAMGTTFTNSKYWDGHRPVRAKKPSENEI
ncbi:uncharacterized protein LOC125501449 isoform X2 [Athalia rosae]|uniref:uncharacterized protein LOC125501449 isoform X2 n=1 Tax=Athalia rosae TaxID=37344 RepID=UPI0020341ECB|nr:uncharacterized protein LOC125501449 isoform X2 [Athalia rosae]